MVPVPYWGMAWSLFPPGTGMVFVPSWNWHGACSIPGNDMAPVPSWDWHGPCSILGMTWPLFHQREHILLGLVPLLGLQKD